MERDDKIVKVMKALLMGLTVEVEGRSYVWRNSALCVGGYQKTVNYEVVDNDVALPVDFTVSQFAAMCESLTPEYMAMLCANIVLNKAKPKR